MNPCSCPVQSPFSVRWPNDPTEATLCDRCDGERDVVDYVPKRIQLRRTKGWRKPPGAILVSRPSKWGNPFPMDGNWIMWTAVSIGLRADKAGRRQAAVALHRAWLLGEPLRLRGFAPIPAVEYDAGYMEFQDGSVVSVADHAAYLAIFGARSSEQPVLPPCPTDFSELRGRDLACWCAPGLSCHADTLLELANAPS